MSVVFSQSKFYRKPAKLYIFFRKVPDFTQKERNLTGRNLFAGRSDRITISHNYLRYQDSERRHIMLQVKNLYKSYETTKTRFPVLKGISFHVEPGEFVAVMGSSGSGKSTLLNCISCYIPYEKGNILLGEQDLSVLDKEGLAKVRNEKLGFVFQDFMLLDGLSVKENILIPRIIRENADQQAQEYADKLMELFGISHIKDKYPAEISGGERQRTAVARSLINDPLLILADEPTGNLDSKSSRAVIEAFEKAKTEMNSTILMVTHDSFSASFCDRVILLKDGMIYKQLDRIGNQNSFQGYLLDTIKEMSEAESEADKR